MKIAIISDIHGNLEAFTSVLADLRGQPVEAVVSLGDNIGYGADSESIIQLLQRHQIFSVLGNHELAVIDRRSLKWFKPNAQQALKQAIESLSSDSVAYIRALKPSLALANGLFVHGFPPDSTRLYLFQLSEAQLLKAFSRFSQPVCFIGHTHVLGLVYRKHQMIRRRPLAKGLLSLAPEQKYIINAGSVGQPRDGNPCAKYLVWDSGTYQLETRFVPYDLTTAAQKIQAAGIPVEFAERLRGNAGR